MLKYKNLKRAFTIVELVIVIAVVAILAAVLIPIFVNVTEEAKLSSDTSLVKNLNTTLAVDEALNGKPATMTDALNVAAESGYSADRLSPVSSGEIVWDSVSNRFALLNDGKVVYQDASTTTLTGPTVWKMTKNVDDLANTGFSWYLQAGGEYGDITAATGVDVGENENINVTIKNATDTASANTAAALARITASAEEAKAITVRTNGGTFTVNASDMTVYHYGTASVANSTAFASLYDYSDITVHNIGGSGTLVRGNTYTAVVENYTSANVTVEGTGASVGAMIASNEAVLATLKDLVAGAGAEVVSTAAVSLEVPDDGKLPTAEKIELGTEKFPYLVNNNDALSKISGMENGRKYYFLINCDITDPSALCDIYEGWFANFEGNITMDLAGHSLNANDMIVFGNTKEDTLTIKNADLKVNLTDATSAFLSVAGSLTLIDCNVSDPYAMQSNKRYIDLVMGSDLIIDGCTFNNVQISYASSLSGFEEEDSNITITNSTFTNLYQSMLTISKSASDVNIKMENCKIISSAHNTIQVTESSDGVTTNINLNNLTVVGLYSGVRFIYSDKDFNITENNCSYTNNGVKVNYSGNKI